jgi:hypothetical protein
MKIIATPIDPKMLKFGDLYSPYPQEAWDKMLEEQKATVDVGLRLCTNMKFTLPSVIPVYHIAVDLTQYNYPGWD